MIPMLLLRFTNNEDIVEINLHKRIYCILENSVYQMLKRRWGVAQSEREYIKLEEPPATSESGTELVPLCYLNLMIPLL